MERIKTLPNTLRVLAITAIISLPCVTQAEIVQLDGLKGEVQLSQSTPTRGMHKKTVLERYGQPSKRDETVGNPPITTWHYPGFTVYFENHLVIHSVLH